MKISKKRAIKLIDNKISQFHKILDEANLNNLYNTTYELAYFSTKNLLTELFSNQDAENFNQNVSSGGIVRGASLDYRLKSYKKHVNSCIAQLMVYKEKIKNFWEPEELQEKSTTTGIPFVAMSLQESDKDINEYVTGILDALEIKFVTGERYSKESIPQKVKVRIGNSELFIDIFVKRDEIKDGGYTTPPWLVKELGFAQGAEKDVIAWVENGIKDIAGLDYEKEVIYFERNNIKSIMKATIKFLEALKEHKLI